MLKLSKRLLSVVELIPSGTAVLDIGCDHAYVAIEAVKSGKCPCAAASDLREGPLEAAEKHIREEGLEGRIVTANADGVPEEWEKLLHMAAGKEDSYAAANVPVTAVTAGMGGLLIKKIFEEAQEREKVRWWVASPQRDAEEVRNTFAENGFEIIDERALFEDGKYYQVILAEQTGRRNPLSKKEALYGPVLLQRHDPALLEHLKKRRTVIENVLAHLPDAEEQRRAELKTELLEITASI